MADPTKNEGNADALQPQTNAERIVQNEAKIRALAKKIAAAYTRALDARREAWLKTLVHYPTDRDG